MYNSLLNLIEEGIKTKEEKIISNISSIIDSDFQKTKRILKYFEKFSIISSLFDSQYVNYFGEITLTELKENNDITNENFAKAIVLFIKEKRKSKNLYFVNLQTENDIRLNILILSQLDYNSYYYEISFNKKLNLIDNLNIFNYIRNINDREVFASLSQEIIEKQIDSPLVNIVNLDKIQYEKVLEYSKKYPNRIRFLDFFKFKDFDKMKELLILNKESLACYPHAKFEFLIPLKNAYFFDFYDYSGNIDDSYDFTKIKYFGRNESYVEKEIYINFFNKCPNLEDIDFYDFNSEYLLDIAKSVNCPKLKRITATIQDMDIEDDFDWNLFFEKFPLLEDISIEEHQTMFWTYEISPIFLAEKKRLPFPLLEQLIMNYLKGSPDRDIKLRFDDEFDEFWDYFKNKKQILNRVSELSGNCVYEKLDIYFKAVINKYNSVDKIKEGKYLYLFVESPFNEQILDFVKRNKVEYLLIKGGGDVNIEELIKCRDLKFIYDNTSKKFFYRKNNCLEKI